MNQPKSNDVKATHAAGQYLGYSLQATRFVSRLLQADLGWAVSLEVFEDVGAESPDGCKIAEQDKSTAHDNPISDRSVDLWKTLSNWILAVQSGELSPDKTTFEFYVSSPKSGVIAQEFSAANSPTEAKNALCHAKEKLWGPAPAFPLRSNVSETIAPYVTKVFESDVSVVCQLIQNFKLECGSGSQHDDLKAMLANKFVPADILNDALDYALGWAKQQIDTLLEHGKPARISVEAFHAAVLSFIRRHDRTTILVTFAGEPSKDEVQADLKMRTYVRQLEIIDFEDSEKLRAVSDFLRAAVDRTRWSEKGLVNSSSFEEFEDGLTRTWDNLRVKTGIALATHSPVEKGRYLYVECSSHQAKLQGLEVPTHFVPGSFHALADTLAVGWHPDYKNQLKANASEAHAVADPK